MYHSLSFHPISNTNNSFSLCIFIGVVVLCVDYAPGNPAARIIILTVCGAFFKATNSFEKTMRVNETVVLTALFAPQFIPLEMMVGLS